MGERNAECRRLGCHPVGDGKRVELTAHREGVHRHLRPVDELLHEDMARARGLTRGLDRGVELRPLAHEREPALPLPVRSLDDARHLDRIARVEHARARLRHAGLVEPLALALLVGGEHRGGGIERVRQAERVGDPGGDGDREVDPGRDHGVDPLGPREPVDPALVLGRDDRAPVGEAEAGRGRIPVDGDHVEPARAGGSEQAELGRPGA